MKKALTAIAVVFIVVVLANLQAQEKTQDKIAIEKILPQKTLLFAKTNDCKKYSDKSKETTLYRLYEYILSPEFFQILKDAGANVQGALNDADEKFKEEMGLSLKELGELPSGECAIAITNFEVKRGAWGTPKPEIELVITCGIGNLEKVNVLLEKIAEKSGELQFYQLGSDKVWFAESDDASVYFTATADLGFVLTVGDKDYFGNTIALLRGEKETGMTLADSTAYKKVTEAISAAKTDYYVYADIRRILAHKDIAKEIVKAVEFLDDTGLSSIKAVGISMLLDDKGRSKDSIYLYAPGEKVGFIKALANKSTLREDGVMFTTEGDMNMFGGVAGASIVAAIAIPSLLKAKSVAYETSAMKSLKMLCETEATWRKNDSDRNSMQDYWTLDVAGFFYTLDGGGNKMQFVDINTAKADPNAQNWANADLGEDFKGIPRNGYLFAMIEIDGDGNQYCKTTTSADLDGNGYPGEKLCGNKTRFGICAYPAKYGVTGTNTYIINQAANVYFRDTGEAKPIKQWPAAENSDPAALTENPWAFAVD